MAENVASIFISNARMVGFNAEMSLMEVAGTRFQLPETVSFILCVSNYYPSTSFIFLYRSHSR